MVGPYPHPDDPSAKHAARREPRGGSGAGGGAEPADTVDWLDGFRRGEPEAFQAIVGRYQSRLVQFFYRLCWDRDRAEDFTQDLFLKLVRGAKNYRPEGRLSTFIFRVATNLWIDHYRSVRPQPRLHSLDQVLIEGEQSLADRTPAPGPTPAQQAVADEEKARLRHAVEGLTEPHRLVFELAVYQELPYPQISEILGIPVGTVKSRMHNSVQALKQLLAEPKGDGSFRRASGGAG